MGGKEIMPKFIILSGKKQAGKTTCANFIKSYIEKQYLKTKKQEESIRCSDYNEKHNEFSLPGLVGCPTNLVKITSFATPIKQFCKDVLGLSHKQIYGTDAEKNTDTNIKWDTMPFEIRKEYGETLHHNPPILGAVVGAGTKYFHTTIELKKGYMTAREVMQIFGTDIMRTFFDYDIWAKAPFKKDWGSAQFVIIDDCRFPNEADISLKNNGLLIRLTRNPLQDTHKSELAMDDYDIDKYSYVIDNASSMSLETLDNIICNILFHERCVE